MAGASVKFDSFQSFAHTSSRHNPTDALVALLLLRAAHLWCCYVGMAAAPLRPQMGVAARVFRVACVATYAAVRAARAQWHMFKSYDAGETKVPHPTLACKVRARGS